MNCPYHRKRLMFVRRVDVFRWFVCPVCRTTEWRMQDDRTGVIAFQKIQKEAGR